MAEPINKFSAPSARPLSIEPTSSYPAWRPQTLFAIIGLHSAFFSFFLLYTGALTGLSEPYLQAVGLLSIPCLITIWVRFPRYYYVSACLGLLIGAYCFDPYGVIVWWLMPCLVTVLSILAGWRLEKTLGRNNWFRDVQSYGHFTLLCMAILLPVVIFFPFAAIGFLNDFYLSQLLIFSTGASAAWVSVIALLPSLLFLTLHRIPLEHKRESCGLLLALFIWTFLGKYTGLYATDSSLQWRIFILLICAAILFTSALRYDLRILGGILVWFIVQTHIEYQHVVISLLSNARQSATIFLLFQFYLSLCCFAANAANLLTIGRTRLIESLRIREERYRSLIENAPEAIVLFTVEPPKIVDLNPAAETILGLSRDAILFQDPKCFSAPLQNGLPLDQAVRQIVRRVLAGEMVETHWQVKHTLDREIPCELRLAVIPEQPVRLLRASLVDISERVQMENERSQLLDERAQLLEMQQLQMNLMPIPCVIKDAQQRFTYWNPAAETLFGYSTNDIVGKTAQQTIVLEKDADAIAQRAERLLSGESMVRGINVNITRSGQEVICEWYNAALRRDGVIIGFLAMAVDITDRTRAERALRESEARYRRMVEGSADGICIHRDGDILYANTAFIQMMGALSTQEIIGCSLLSMIAPEYSENIQTLLLDGAINERTPKYHESCLRCVDGSTLEVELACSTIYIDGLPYRQIEFRDISAQKWSEREMKRLNVDLEKRVELRTAALEQANRELESFSYSVAHDLRAPLRAISGFTTIVRQEYESHLDEQAKLYLQRISTNADKMAQLIEDLLSYARIGRSEMKMESINLNTLIDKVLEDLHELWPKHHITVGDMPTVFGDDALLKQMLTNLITNACKFSQKNLQPQVEIGCIESSSSFNFFIRDNGVGFDQQYAHKLFGMFQRLHSTNEYEGTGVGLAIVQRVVNRHGGKIWAHGEVGVGATFYFSLPLITHSYDKPNRHLESPRI